jgi:hypothetical protein
MATTALLTPYVEVEEEKKEDRKTIIDIIIIIINIIGICISS